MAGEEIPVRLTIIGAALGSILSIQAMATDYIYKVAYPAIALCPEQADVQKLFRLINADDVPPAEIAAFGNASGCLILHQGAKRAPRPSRAAMNRNRLG
jgi:hypothetical protein